MEIDDEFGIAISVRDVVDLNSFDLNISFPPDKLEVLTIEKGSYFEKWIIPINEFYNDIGSIKFDFSQGNPTPPKSGNGDLVIIRFKALPGMENGIANVLIKEESLFSDINGSRIEKSIENGIVFLDYPFQIYLPLIKK